GVPLLFEKLAATIQRRVREATPFRRRTFTLLCRLSRLARAAGWRRAGRLLLASVRKRGGLASLQVVVSGGAALPAEVAEFFDTIGIPLVQGYGLSEASPVVSVNRTGAHRYDTVGPALPGVQVSLRDPAPDGTGEIVVRGPNVTQGYWRRPAETAAILQDGWLLTGDLGRIDRDGHLHILGRSKNVIVSGAGKNIYPEEIEGVLDAQPEIAESLVYGKTRPGRIGETVAAIIVPDREWLKTTEPGKLDDAVWLRGALSEAVGRACAQLAQYKRITEWEVRREPFVRTATRKIKRHLAVPDPRVPGL
ncbi:MAG TPA: AMP-binding protein, partial [Acidobacteriota bacterium]|nr:AMP-binding protein [Acidobacteriota bacterium]